MKMMSILAACGAVLAAAGPAAIAQEAEMSFFVTSQGPGDGANLGGLDGADAHCQQLADAAGGGGKTWGAYLSTSTDAEPVGIIGLGCYRAAYLLRHSGAGF